MFHDMFYYLPLFQLLLLLLLGYEQYLSKDEISLELRIMIWEEHMTYIRYEIKGWNKTEQQ